MIVDGIPQLEERERQAKAEMAARMSKLNQVELKRKKEEDIAVCYVCNSGDHVENKEDIVFCERCCVAVHMSCYNAEEVSTQEGPPSRGRCSSSMK